jgi:large subunit ribosomal protein L7/L12
MKELRTELLQELGVVLANLTILEAKELVRILEKDHGIVHVNPYKQVLTSPVLEPEVQNEYEVWLMECGPSKLQVVKDIKEITGLGLRDAKDIADAAPSLIRKGCMNAEAHRLKEDLECVGATVEIK